MGLGQNANRWIVDKHFMVINSYNTGYYDIINGRLQ